MIKIMKGRTYKDRNDIQNRYWITTKKIDGVRRIFHKDAEGNVICYNRNLIEDFCLDHICEEFKKDKYPSNYIYDCEIVDKTFYFEEVESLALRISTISKINTLKNSLKYQGDLLAICFDMYKADEDLTVAEARFGMMEDIFKNNSDKDIVQMVPYYGIINGNHVYEIFEIFECVLNDENGEGLMLLDTESIYINGRTSNLIKLKRVKDFRGVVLEAKLGKKGTKLQDKVSSILCEIEGSGEIVNVGTGFTDEERIDMVINSPIGKTVEIEAFSSSTNKKGEKSLNQPVFKRFEE